MIDAEKSAREYAENEELPPELPAEFHRVIRAQLRNAFMKGSTRGLRISQEIIQEHASPSTR